MAMCSHPLHPVVGGIPLLLVVLGMSLQAPMHVHPMSSGLGIQSHHWSTGGQLSHPPATWDH